jgi:hypothetical protein
MGRPANLHAQMAHSRAVLTAYTSLRAVLAEHTTFDPKVGAALTLAAAAGRASRLATIRDIDGCDTPSSRATREKLPVSPARTKAVNSRSASLMPLAYKSDTRRPSTARAPSTSSSPAVSGAPGG